ncbi:sialin [Schistocerca piceifrons]|uniref:sialin n=1 Tax=Schistocerca piceifrons TaxID=274613 RepID=UPI001F5FD32B|nr:sialin [Schistocerca piceifrons]
MAGPAKGRKLSGLSGCLSCRQVLNIMVILGFMFNYMLRVNLTIAIVAMVLPTNHSQAAAGNATLGSSPSTALDNTTLAEAAAEGGVEQTRYDWDEYWQNMIIGCFFWGYVCTEFPGGRLAELIGGRRVFGTSMLVGSVLTLLTPLSARLGIAVVILLRVVLGLSLGVTWPSIHPMVAKWIPPMERSKFIANTMASALGAAITMPVCGLLIASFGWESVFYSTGLVGTVWSIAWFFLIYDSPAQHPRISYEEREYIEKAIGSTTKKGKALPLPWRHVLTSGPVWAIIIAHACSIFGYFTVINQLPTYMKYILDFKIKENGLLSSLPYLGKYLFAVAMSALADHLRQSGRLSTTVARKLFTTIALVMPAIAMAVQLLLGEQRAAAVACFTIALTFNGAVTAGYLGNGLDIAPNFSGTIFGMAQTLSSFTGFLSSAMVGSLTQGNQTFGQWQKVFGILVGTYTAGALAYLVLGSGELQHWNNPPGSTATSNGKDLADEGDAEEEATPLRKL